MSDQAKEPSQWAKDIAKRIAGWMCRDDDDPTDSDLLFIAETVDAATAQKDAEIVRLKAHVGDLIAVESELRERHQEAIAEAVALQQELGLLKHSQACELDGWQSVSRSRDSWQLIATKGQERMAELADLADKAMAVMAHYINVPEALALRERWEKLKNQ